MTRENRTIRSYWNPRCNVGPTLSPEDWTGLVRTRMEEAVRMQRVSDVPIGAFLSGGVDSSAVGLKIEQDVADQLRETVA